MKKTHFVIDCLFSLWLVIASTMAVFHGGKGLHAWPLIPLGIVMLLISGRRFWFKECHYFKSAAWHVIIILLCAFSIFQEYLYTKLFNFSANPEVLAIGALSILLFTLNIYLILIDRRSLREKPII
jgi:hypothetical protein